MRQQNMVNWYAVSHRLRTARIMLGISEAEAARGCRVSLRTYRRYEIGRPQRDSGMIDFGNKFGISLSWLATGEGAYVENDLAKCAPGKIAILPSKGRSYRSVKVQRFHAEVLPMMVSDLVPK
jgi:transcriptional regulator with XRE-family HTH domain